MKTVLRPLVFMNALAVMVFLFPVVVWLAVETSTRGTPKFELAPIASGTQEVEQIRAIKDLETLRLRAYMLEQTLDFERRTRSDEALFIKQLSGGLGLLLLIAATGFLVNAILLLWALRRQTAPG